jgi:hypothetical protein
VITAIGEELWAVDSPFRVIGVHLGARMTVARLSGNRLWLHSPVTVDDAARAELEKLGSVAHVVAPSKVHHLFVKPLIDSHPNAKLHGAPGLAAKRRDLAFTATLADGSPSPWSDSFLHRPSRSLIVTDVAFNIASAEHWWTRTYLRMMGAYGGFGQSKMVRLCVTDRAKVRASIDRVLDWNFDRVVVTHGAVLESGGKDALRRVFAWL